MKKSKWLFVFLLLIGCMASYAQNTQIKGKITSAEDGGPLPGASVVIKGTSTGTATNIDGDFTITASTDATLLISSVGFVTQEIAVAGQTIINVVMEVEALEVDEVVVTALGISREKKSLGYAAQEVKGDAVSTVKTDNLINNLSGKIAGVSIKVNGNMGGSTNVVIRGSKSLYQSNQALFVIDGVPVDNSNTNNQGEIDGRSGYDYGNAASDLNPNDVESMTILKGAAATALYGSRAANGVIMITTKKGAKAEGKALGVTVNSNVTFGVMDKSTFPEYQKEYGGGYGAFYYSGGLHPGLEEYADVDGDGTVDLTVPYYEDASFGEKFDPSLMVFQWDALYKSSPNYLKATPWVAAENGPETFFETAVSYTNTIDVSGGTEKSTFRLSYTNLNQSGIMPNSSLKRNNITFNGSYNLLKNLKVSASVNYANTNTTGRNSTGYNDNILSSFRQWYQVNVDIQDQKELFEATDENVTWNPVAYDDLTPIYWDNPYWIRHKNFESDERNRIIGYTQVDWTVTSWMSIMGRVSLDTYDELQEERKAIGSVAGELGVDRPDVTSGYSRFARTFLETNTDLMAKFHKNFTESLEFTGLLGTNIRRTNNDHVFASTNGGLSVPDIYALSVSVDNMLPPEEGYEREGINGIYASVSLGYRNMLYLDATLRRDQSSTLPKDNWTYYYPSVSGTFIFSEILNPSWLSLGKVRLNYAQVGSDAPWGVVTDTYSPIQSFNGNALFSVSDTKNNLGLKPERTKSIEAGLEMSFVQNRLGFDLALYQTNTVDQITPLQVSFATGYYYKYLNAGEIQNKGIELTLHAVPVKISAFQWDIDLNFARNVNKVVSLAEGLQNLPINDGLQGGVTINARKGESYGAIQGSDFVFDETSGKRVVKDNGYYKLSPTSDIVIGNINPDWTAGIMNSFQYKNLSLGFLIDMQQGGDIFSLDLWYGMGTGLYPETVGNNDLGNPIRDQAHEDPFDIETPLVENPGGVILDGVREDGSPNTLRVEGCDYRLHGWNTNPNSKFIYDASYVKLREANITYSLPRRIMEKTFIYGASISFVGSNLWIIHKNLPYADPEASQSSGNTQGWQSGVMPSTRNFGFTLNLQF